MSLELLAAQLFIPWDIVDAKIDLRDGSIEFIVAGDTVPGQHVEGGDPAKLHGLYHSEECGHAASAIWKADGSDQNPLSTFIRETKTGNCFWCKKPQGEHMPWPARGLLCPGQI